MKILLGDLNEKMEIGNILKTTIADMGIHQDSKDNSVKRVDYYT
jgi:hypothetical protein